MIKQKIKLISLNMEGDKHLPKQKEFFLNESPDILCLQEIFEDTYLKIKRVFKLKGHFAPMWKIKEKKNGKKILRTMGIALLTKLPVEKFQKIYYNGDYKSIHNFIPGVTSQEKLSRVVIILKIRKKRDYFIIGNTHFTWSKDGKTSQQQIINLENLLKKIEVFPEIILCGDFNAPRGKKIFKKISEKYIDNIPNSYKTSIDKNLHYAGKLNLMVDGLFSTNKYQITNVTLINNISDHLAIKADVQIKPKKI